MCRLDILVYRRLLSMMRDLRSVLYLLVGCRTWMVLVVCNQWLADVITISAPVPIYPSRKLMYGSVMLTVSTQLMITYRVALDDMENLLTRLGSVTPTDALDSTFRNVLTHSFSTIPRGRSNPGDLVGTLRVELRLVLVRLRRAALPEAARTVDNTILSASPLLLLSEWCVWLGFVHMLRSFQRLDS